MAILKVAHMGHPVLRTVAQPVRDDQIDEADTQRLIEDMIETMEEYHGVGLAGPQVHVASRILVVQKLSESEDAIEALVLFTPEIEPIGSEMQTGWEGCLSIPDVRGRVPRHGRISVSATSREGTPYEFEAEGFDARVIQHEVDHLDGILYVDRMDGLSTLCFLDEYSRYWADEEDEEEE